MDVLRQASWACAKLIEVIDRHHEMAAGRFLEGDRLTSRREYNLDFARSGNVKYTVPGVHDCTECFQGAEAEQTGEVFARAFDDWRL